jgi:hypothetical protein
MPTSKLIAFVKTLTPPKRAQSYLEERSNQEKRLRDLKDHYKDCSFRDVDDDGMNVLMHAAKLGLEDVIDLIL